MKRIKGLYSLSIRELDSKNSNGDSSHKHTKIAVRSLKKLIEKLKK